MHNRTPDRQRSTPSRPSGHQRRYHDLLMGALRLRSGLRRVVIDGFALPLGIEPGDIQPPTQGFTIAYNTSQDEEPDTYSFHVVVSHERIAPILHEAFELLPEQVAGIVEISSRDAYRTVDVYVSHEPVAIRDFLRTWQRFEPLLLEDAALAAGANSDDPCIEVFLDQWKGLSIIVPLSLREEIEALMTRFDLEEVPQTWPGDDGQALSASQIRPVIEYDGDDSADLEDLLMELRYEWRLELDVDLHTNVDDAGRNLGYTLWRAVVGVEDPEGNSTRGADMVIWATADSLSRLDELINEALDSRPAWRLAEIFAVDRVAFDDRPDELSALPPKRREAEVHLVQIEPWPAPPDEAAFGRNDAGTS